MSGAPDKLLEMTCSKYLQEVAKFNLLPHNVISLERKFTYILYTYNMYITNKVTIL